MPKILVNYTYNKKNDSYTLLNSDVVFADMPIAIMEMGAEYDEILVVSIQNQNTIVDKAEYLSLNKQFKLAVNEDGTVVESEDGTSIWLPKNTDVTKLRIVNGQLCLVEGGE